MLSVQLVDEVRALCEEGLTASLTEVDGFANVEIAQYPVEYQHYNKTSVCLLLKLPLSYPNGKPDMFWVNQDFLLKDGRVPRSAEVVEACLGQPRRRFSWHLSSWNPGADNLRTFLEFINNRLAKPE